MLLLYIQPVCGSAGGQRQGAIQALHWAHLRSALHVARLSGDLARPIFTPPPPPLRMWTTGLSLTWTTGLKGSFQSAAAESAAGHSN